MSTPNLVIEESVAELDVSDSHVDNKDKIVSVLTRLYTAGTLINVKIEGADRHYTSAFLSIDPKSNTIQLDELVPSKANQGLQNGTSISISSRLLGVTVWFKSRITDIDNHDRILRYTAKMPDMMIYNERRDDFRCSLGGNMVIHLRGKHPVTGTNLFGSLIDISSSGCAFKLSGNQYELNRGVMLRPVTLIFPDDTSIHTNLSIQNQTTTRQTRSTRYGGEFHFRDETQKKLIHRLILDLQQKTQYLEEA